MQTSISPTPDVERLAARVSAAVARLGRVASPVAVLDRRRSRYKSPFPEEIVTCRLPDGTRRRLFVKYAAGGADGVNDRPGSVAYESEVYGRVLSLYEDARPRFYGAHTDRRTGEAWLVLECLDRCTRVRDVGVRRRQVPRPVAMLLAAGWIARFHAALEAHHADEALAFLNHCDLLHLRLRTLQNLERAPQVRRALSWLAPLCDRMDELLAPLRSAPHTVIHGAFGPGNILLRQRQVHPVGWESTAIGPGEIDLAELTDGRCPPRLVARCERLYRASRWSDGGSQQFERRMEAARLYLHFRMVGERPEAVLLDRYRYRLDYLRRAADYLGLVEQRARQGPA